jgi:hypothetical protein
MKILLKKFSVLQVLSLEGWMTVFFVYIFGLPAMGWLVFKILDIFRKNKNQPQSPEDKLYAWKVIFFTRHFLTILFMTAGSFLVFLIRLCGGLK